MGVAPPTASHWALRPRPLTCRRHCTSFSGNAQADNIFRTLFANKRIHIWGGPNPPLLGSTAHAVECIPHLGIKVLGLELLRNEAGPPATSHLLRNQLAN